MDNKELEAFEDRAARAAGRWLDEYENEARPEPLEPEPLEAPAGINARICPICGNPYTERPAISRRDNKTEICPNCGTLEGLTAAGIAPDTIAEIMDTIKEKQAQQAEPLEAAADPAEDYTLNLQFTVKRIRPSVSQGEAHVFCNGKYITNFGDKIEMITPGKRYYGPLIGNWASVTPDAQFVRAALFHNLDHVYHISDPIRRIIDAEITKQRENAPRREDKTEQSRGKQ